MSIETDKTGHCMPEANEYQSADYAKQYLEKADAIPHRSEGESMVLELLPASMERVLDLGAGDGRLLAFVKTHKSVRQGIGLDFSPTMLQQAQERFWDDPSVEIIEHDLNKKLPVEGPFDAIVSSFAIHHVSDERKRSLYREIFELLAPGGVFCNLEHVASPTQKLHEDFYRALGSSVEHEDPSNQCTGVEEQLNWMRKIGFSDVDCFWKWRELALLAGLKV